MIIICDRTGKIRYSKKGARTALKKVKERRASNPEKHYYRCAMCGDFHLASKKFKDVATRNKKQSPMNKPKKMREEDSPVNGNRWKTKGKFK